MIQVIEGDLFTTGAKYIAHQCNCTSTGMASGIARIVFDRYPYSDCYLDRRSKGIPGTIDIRGDGLVERFIINMFAQYNPGKFYNHNDNEQLRRKWFYKCLLEISNIENLESIAFPYFIGCGLAGGDWDWYYKHLEKFEKVVSPVNVLLYKLEK